VAELRYVDLRFGRRLGRRLSWAMAATLAVIVLARILPMADPALRPVAIIIELCGGASLVALVLPSLARAGPWTGLVGVLAAAGLALAILVSPTAGLLALAVLHNLTPVGFLLEANAGMARRRAAWWCSVVFLVVPLVIATGWVWWIVSTAGIASPEASPLGYGPLHDAMRAYLPVALLSPAVALHSFCACVFLQCAHYVTVLLVMPRLLPDGARGRLRWPGPRVWPVVLTATVLALVPFAIEFADARRAYGVVAAIHAWIELPILLLALCGTGRAPRRHQP
nr:hypothetical protein [Deltaproteobacteria bacterium]